MLIISCNTNLKVNLFIIFIYISRFIKRFNLFGYDSREEIGVKCMTQFLNIQLDNVNGFCKSEHR